jgi:hypothetical protein
VTPEERWSFREARELEVDAHALMREFLPDRAIEGGDLDAELGSPPSKEFLRREGGGAYQ